MRKKCQRAFLQIKQKKISSSKLKCDFNPCFWIRNPPFRVGSGSGSKRCRSVSLLYLDVIRNPIFLARMRIIGSVSQNRNQKSYCFIERPLYMWRIYIHTWLRDHFNFTISFMCHSSNAQFYRTNNVDLTFWSHKLRVLVRSKPIKNKHRYGSWRAKFFALNRFRKTSARYKF